MAISLFFYNLGWSCRDVTSEDVRLIPLISGRGKQCRLMGTVGVARGLGDHDLIVKSSLVNCKEFLSCQPEVRVKCIDDLHPDSVLILASGRHTCGVQSPEARISTIEIGKVNLGIPGWGSFNNYVNIILLFFNNVDICQLEHGH